MSAPANVAGVVVGVGILAGLATFAALVGAIRGAFYLGRVAGWAGTGCPL